MNKHTREIEERYVEVNEVAEWVWFGVLSLLGAASLILWCCVGAG